jgi:hypothetical protein
MGDLLPPKWVHLQEMMGLLPSTCFSGVLPFNVTVHSEKNPLWPRVQSICQWFLQSCSVDIGILLPGKGKVTEDEAMLDLLLVWSVSYHTDFFWLLSLAYAKDAGTPKQWAMTDLGRFLRFAGISIRSGTKCNSCMRSGHSSQCELPRHFHSSNASQLFFARFCFGWQNHRLFVR